MNDAKLGNIRVLGIGQLGVAIASYFNRNTLTSGLDYSPESIKNSRVDNALQLKKFDGTFGSKNEELVRKEKEVIMDNLSSPIVFIVAQVDGRFQESIIPPLLKLFKSSGIFTGFFPIFPIGADRKGEMERLSRMKRDLDMLEIVDSESILSASKDQPILDINSLYHKHIWEKIKGIANVVGNSMALGISLHDIKMMTDLYGPLQLSVFSYSFVNFSIAERDLFGVISKWQKDKIKRVYMVLEIGNDVDSSDVILFVRKVKNRVGNIDLRQGFIHTSGDFGLIIINFGSLY